MKPSLAKDMKPSSTYVENAVSLTLPEGEIPFWWTYIGEEEKLAVMQTFENKSFSVGPATAEMESEISKALDVPYALCTTSGSMAMVMGLMAAGIGPGDEVIVPTRSYIATAHAASLLGAKVVLMDCLENSTAMDVADAERKVTSRTKAIMPVHLNGRVCDMEALDKLSRKHNLFVVEDACQSFLSRNAQGYAGTLGDVGCFSFGMAKLINTGQGGAVVTRSKDLYDRLKGVRNHGVADVTTHAYSTPGNNFKFNDIQAAMGVWQVRRGPEKVAHVKAIYEKYREGIKGLPFIELLPVDIENGEIPLMTEVLGEGLDDEGQDRLMNYLADRGVPTRKWKPCLHTAAHFDVGEAFPNSERLYRLGFSLPGGPALPFEYVDRAIDAINSYDL